MCFILDQLFDVFDPVPLLGHALAAYHAGPLAGHCMREAVEGDFERPQLEFLASCINEMNALYCLHPCRALDKSNALETWSMLRLVERVAELTVADVANLAHHGANLKLPQVPILHFASELPHGDPIPPLAHQS